MLDFTFHLIHLSNSSSTLLSLLQADWTYRWTRPTLTFGEFLLLYVLPVRPGPADQ